MTPYTSGIHTIAVIPKTAPIQAGTSLCEAAAVNPAPATETKATTAPMIRPKDA
jgi:hypothetical protein